MGWASTEFETIDLGDERRNKRAIRLAESLSAQPMASVPQTSGGWADTMAACGFFDNEAVDWRAILGAHTDCAMTRVEPAEPMVMAIAIRLRRTDIFKNLFIWISKQLSIQSKYLQNGTKTLLNRLSLI